MTNPDRLTYDPNTGSCEQLPAAVAIKYFFASQKTHPFEYATAKAICANCPIQEDCLTDAIEQPDRYGIRGGENGQRVRELRNAGLERSLTARQVAKAAMDAQVVLHGAEGFPGLRRGNFPDARVVGAEVAA